MWTRWNSGDDHLMDEQQVRVLVRQAIARHLGPAGTPVDVPPPSPVATRAGISHARFHLVRPPDEVECLIEPTVVCNHCGFCQCYGH